MMTSIKTKYFLSFNSSFYLKKMGLVISRLFVHTEKENESKEYDVEIATTESEETENFVQNILESKYLLKLLEFFRNSFFLQTKHALPQNRRVIFESFAEMQREKVL
uniref:Uncharacterized protein n=1 Tax=Marseillevirus sp. TaxID=2809551 RepID=A0AA96EM21_9VIRU|nr:hypothetical protein MarDSR_065 [Marseillevirus sp.]